LFERTKSTDAALRERLLWAFGNLAEPAASKALKAGLSAKEDVAVRRAAVRGIAALKDPQMADALVATVGDADAGVRKLAVEALAALGSSEQHVDALWERMTSVQETDETIRQAALRGVIEMLVKMTTPGMEKWLARVPQTTAQERTRAVELLERLVKLSSEAEPPDQARVGAARARLAGHYAQLDRPVDAVTAYCGAISELQAAGSDSCGRTALELLRVALLSGRYDMQVAAAVGGAIGKADRDAVWEVVRTSIEARLTPENLDQALAMITALETNPPGAWTPEAAEGLRQLRHRAAQIKQVAAGSPAARATNGAESRLPG
jgi:HEAT repeat protein